MSDTTDTTDTTATSQTAPCNTCASFPCGWGFCECTPRSTFLAENDTLSCTNSGTIPIDW